MSEVDPKRVIAKGKKSAPGYSMTFSSQKNT